jgi:hypothetical protein
MCPKIGAWMKEGLPMERNLARQARFALWLAALLLALPSLTQAQQDTQTHDPSGTGSSSADGVSQSAQLPDPPVITSMDTGQPLNTKGGALPAGRVAALLSIGHLTVLSLSTFYEYDSNLEFTSQPQAASALAIQGLLRYSIGNDRTALDLQYRPYVLFAQGTAQADLAANSLNLHIHHYLNPLWLLNFEDHFQYAPAQGNTIDPTIRPDLSATGNISRDPFLFDGQTTLNNTAVVQARYSDDYDTITFQGQYQYVETWNPPSSTNSTNPAKPAPTGSQQDNTGGAGISWSRKLDTDKVFGISYRYDRQLIGGGGDQFQYNSLLFNYSQRIRPSLQVLLAGGPSWQVPRNGATHKTFVGSAEILKSFRASTVVVSYARNYDYIGVVSDSYYTRYDAYYMRSLGRRWEFSVGAGYAQQSFTKLPAFDGREEWARGSYFLSEKLSAFLSFANAAAQGGSYPYASRNLVIAGFRWAYRQEQ